MNFLKKLNNKEINTYTLSMATTILNSILGFVFFAMAANSLGPSQFGLFWTVIVLITLTSDLADLGVNTGIVKFIPKFKNKKTKTQSFLANAFWIKNISLLICSVLIFIFINLIPNFHDLILAYPYIILGIAGSMWISMTTSTLQAKSRFISWSIVSVSANLLRLALFFYIVNITHIITWQSAAISYIAPLFVGFILGLIILPNFINKKPSIESSKEIFRFTKWIAGYIPISAFVARLDILLANYLLDTQTIGIYSVAANLAGVTPQIVYSISVVLAPRIASMRNAKKVLEYLIKVQVVTFILAIVGITVTLPLANYIIPNFYGTDYVSSISPLFILILAQAIFFISIPAHISTIYYFANPKIFMYISIAQLITIPTATFLLVPAFGVNALAFSVLLSNLISFTIPFVSSYNKFKHHEDNSTLSS